MLGMMGQFYGFVQANAEKAP